MEVYSNNFTIDSSAPHEGTVYDGLRKDEVKLDFLCHKFKAALVVFLSLILSSPYLHTRKNKQCKRVFGSIVRLERNS